MGYTTFSTLYLFAGEHTRFHASLLIPTEAVGGTSLSFHLVSATFMSYNVG